jgi:hypothetical protein
MTLKDAYVNLLQQLHAIYVRQLSRESGTLYSCGGLFLTHI